MQMQNLNVVVAGGATGGAATALLLARAGARVVVLERVAHPRAVGAGIGLAANGLAVLESLGLGPAIAAAACSVGSGRIVDGRGRVLLAPPEPRPRIEMIRRATLQGVLLDAMAAEARISRHFGVEVVRAAPDGSVTARGAEGVLHFKADLVVGADGVHSKVREGGDFGARVSPPGLAYVRALVPEGLARCEEAWTAAGLFGSFPVDGATYVYASAGAPACRAAAARADLDAFRAAWRRAYPPAEALLGALGTWSDLIVNRVVRVDCNRWFSGRLVLVGDAAHAMAPNLGQGANSALVDAAILLDALRRHADISAALAAYDARRRPAVRRVAQLSARLGALAERTHPVARGLRDYLLMPLANRLASEQTNGIVLQESPGVLLSIGRGQRAPGDRETLAPAP